VKVGDLVKPKHKYSNNEVGIGIVLKVEENFFKTYNDYFEDRLIIHWIHGETTLEPDSYVEKLAENKMKVGDLVRYTPDGHIDDRWAAWYGLVVRMIPGTSEMTVVRWNKDNSTTLSIRKRDLTVVNSS